MTDRKKSKIQRVVILLFMSSILTVALIPLGNWGHEIKLQVSIVSFLFFSWWQIATKKELMPVWLIVACIMLPGCLFYGSAHAYEWQNTLLSLPSSLAVVPGTLLGAALATAENNIILKRSLITLIVVVVIFSTSYGYEKWMHKLNHGSFSWRVTETVSSVEIVDEKGNLMTKNDFAGKIAILDFWTTSCGVCFAKFPRVESLYQELRARQDILLIAVNVPGKEERSKAVKLIRDRGLTFPIGFMDAAVAKKQFDVHTFPTVICIKNGNQVFYRGNIENIYDMLHE